MVPPGLFMIRPLVFSSDQPASFRQVYVFLKELFGLLSSGITLLSSPCCTVAGLTSGPITGHGFLLQASFMSRLPLSNLYATHTKLFAHTEFKFKLFSWDFVTHSLTFGVCGIVGKLAVVHRRVIGCNSHHKNTDRRRKYTSVSIAKLPTDLYVSTLIRNEVTV